MAGESRTVLVGGELGLGATEDFADEIVGLEGGVSWSLGGEGTQKLAMVDVVVVVEVRLFGPCGVRVRVRGEAKWGRKRSDARATSDLRQKIGFAEPARTPHRGQGRWD